MTKKGREPDVPDKLKDAVEEGLITEEEVKLTIKEINKPAKIGILDNEDTQSQYLLKELQDKNRDKEVTIISKEGGNTAIVKECEDKEITDLYVPLTNTDWLVNSKANSLDKLKHHAAESHINIITPLLVHDTAEIEKRAAEEEILAD